MLASDLLSRRTPHAIGGNLAALRQANQPPLMQLHQQRSGGHVLKLARSVSPTPLRGQLSRQTPSAPVRMLAHPLPYPFQIRLTHTPEVAPPRVTSVQFLE